MYKRRDPINEYKSDIKSKFKQEQLGLYSSFLQNPSRAKLRKLCVERMKENKSNDDLNSFKLFTGFEFKDFTNIKMSEKTDKFRPIESFFLDDSDLSDLITLEMAAILVDFHPRPFKKFSKNENLTIVQELEVLDTSYQSLRKEDTSLIKEHFLKNEEIKKPNKIKKYLIGFIIAIGFLGTTYTTNMIFFNKPQCMVWDNNTYMKVDCDNSSTHFFNETIPYNEIQFQLKKIELNDSMTFFKGNIPLYFYAKVNGKVEFFNQMGVHPETGKYLKPVTSYIINEHVKKSD